MLCSSRTNLHHLVESIPARCSLGDEDCLGTRDSKLLLWLARLRPALLMGLRPVLLWLWLRLPRLRPALLFLACTCTFPKIRVLTTGSCGT